MDVKKSTQKIDQINKWHEKGKIAFDLTIQRKEGIWDTKRKSKLIHSVLVNYPIPPVFAKREDTTYHILDGKQRLTSIIDFVLDKFSLSKDISSVSGIELPGKKFSELPEDMQQKILEQAIEINYVEEIEQAEMEELFFRLNNGVPLRSVELTRALLGGKVLQFVEKIASLSFFAEKVNLSPSARKRYVDQEIVLQIMALIQNRDTGFSGVEIQEFVKTLRDSEIRDELKARMQNASAFLNLAFLNKEKFLKKVHIPMLFKLALDVQSYGLLVTPEQFGEWASQFFADIPETYALASSQGSAKKENVQRRLAAISQAFNVYFQIQERGQEMFASETGNSQDAV